MVAEQDEQWIGFRTKSNRFLLCEALVFREALPTCLLHDRFGANHAFDSYREEDGAEANRVALSIRAVGIKSRICEAILLAPLRQGIET